VAIILHWTMAVAILAMIGIGWTMGDMPPGAEQFALVQLHKSIGVTLLVLTVLRLLWRLCNPPPEAPQSGAPLSKIAALAHAGFYALMVAMPLSGWILVSASPAGIATTLYSALPWPHLPGLPDLPRDAKEAIEGPIEFIHSKLAWVMIALLALHVGAALKHQFLDRDGVMARMAPGVFGKADPPQTPARGYLIAFGSVVALVVAIIALGLATPTAGSQPQVSDAGATPSAAPFWDVDPSASSIRFAGAYMGKPFEGSFQRWNAQIQFDQDRPQDARIRVTIATGSAVTGETYFDENLREGDWFDIVQHPDAVFEVNEGVFRLDNGSYEATGILTLKGIAHPVRLPFSLTFDGDTAQMNATTSLSRIALGVGADTKTEESGDEEWVRDDVMIDIAVSARRRS
jgi:cytochrome b561